MDVFSIGWKYALGCSIVAFIVGAPTGAWVWGLVLSAGLFALRSRNT